MTADSEVRSDDEYAIDSAATLLDGIRGVRHPTGLAGRRRGARAMAATDGSPLERNGLHLVALQTDPTEMFRLVWRNRTELGLHDNAFTRIASVRPCVRVSPDDGAQLRETVVEVTQYVTITGDAIARLRPALVPSGWRPTSKTSSRSRAAPRWSSTSSAT